MTSQRYIRTTYCIGWKSTCQINSEIQTPPEITRTPWLTQKLEIGCSVITARKRSLGQGNIFTPVCHSVHTGVVSQHALQVISQHALQWGVCYPSMHCRWYPSMPCSRGGRGCLLPGGAWSGRVCSRGVPGGGRGSAPGGGCLVETPPDGYCCRRNASYTSSCFGFTVSQGSHSTWKTWKNESPPGKPGNIMEFWKI